MKKMKIYSEKEIDNAASVMEKTRRNFWNVKAEQLCTKTKTACLNKQILMGIIDVSWTLRKTALIEEEASMDCTVSNVHALIFPSNFIFFHK